jgi:hypothetical protein
MLNVVRLRQLSSRVEFLVGRDNVVNSPTLCSLVTSEGALPLSALLMDPSFVRQRVSIAEIATACVNLNLKLVGPSHVRLPYHPIKHVLRVSTRASNCDTKKFLTLLSGSPVKVQARPEYFLISTDIPSIFALWRALQFVPFQGEFMRVCMHSAPLPEVKPNPRLSVTIEPRQVKTITIERKTETTAKPENEIRSIGQSTSYATLPKTGNGKGSRKWRGNEGRIPVPPLNETNFPSLPSRAS